jgi:hypothetical protein
VCLALAARSGWADESSKLIGPGSIPGCRAMLYHASALTREQVLEAPVLHVGDLSQAKAIFDELLLNYTCVYYFKNMGKNVSENNTLEDILQVRVLYKKPDIYELSLCLLKTLHKNLTFTDNDVNCIHVLHAQHHNYPISTSILHSADFNKCEQDPEEGFYYLNKGYTLRYENVAEGGGTSYLVPSPWLACTRECSPEELSSAVYNRQPSVLERAIGGTINNRR